MGSVKRSHSPEDRSPLLPMMNHSSKRLAGDVRSTTNQPITRLTKHYDGLGGRSRLDMFPQHKSTFSVSQKTSSSKVKTSKTVVVNKQTRTIDKFFGSFDTP